LRVAESGSGVVAKWVRGSHEQKYEVGECRGKKCWDEKYEREEYWVEKCRARSAEVRTAEGRSVEASMR